MQSIGEIAISALKTVTCKNCGNEVSFAPKQWRKPCRCGMVITVPALLRLVRQSEEHAPTCFICHDKGLVFYKAQEGGIVYNFVAKCTCRIGEARDENYPKVSNVDNIANLQWLEMKNRKEWEKRTGKKADVALLDNSEVIEVPAEGIPF